SIGGGAPNGSTWPAMSPGLIGLLMWNMVMTLASPSCTAHDSRPGAFTVSMACAGAITASDTMLHGPPGTLCAAMATAVLNDTAAAVQRHCAALTYADFNLGEMLTRI